MKSLILVIITFLTTLSYGSTDRPALEVTAECSMREVFADAQDITKESEGLYFEIKYFYGNTALLRTSLAFYQSAINFRRQAARSEQCTELASSFLQLNQDNQQLSRAFRRSPPPADRRGEYVVSRELRDMAFILKRIKSNLGLTIAPAML